MNYFKSTVIIFFLYSILNNPLFSQEEKPNYDEDKIPSYSLRDPLMNESGEKIETIAQWEQEMRPSLIQLFKDEMFGHVPDVQVKVAFEIKEVESNALAGTAQRKLVNILIGHPGKQSVIELLLYLPKNTKGPSPLFLGMNFNGNHTIHPDEGIPITKSWVRNNEAWGIKDHSATNSSRGLASRRWPVEKIISQGFGLGVIYYGDVDPDFDDGFSNGIHRHFNQQGVRPLPHQWGSIASWAWALSRAMDYFQYDPDVEEDQVAVFGHSRLGKTSLWAGAMDDRFALVISNNSGCGGAALSKRKIGETVKRINTSFPHWFNDNFQKFNGKEDEMPFDQHLLVSLMAPRPVYIASAEEDQWADPRGEFLSAYYASPVYRLYDLDAIESKEMPLINTPVNTGSIAYHIRTGKHDVTDYDWDQYISFAKKHFTKRSNK